MIISFNLQSFYGQSIAKPRWRECVTFVKETAGMVISQKFVEKENDISAIKGVRYKSNLKRCLTYKKTMEGINRHKLLGKVLMKLTKCNNNIQLALKRKYILMYTTKYTYSRQKVNNHLSFPWWSDPIAKKDRKVHNVSNI